MFHELAHLGLVVFEMVLLFHQFYKDSSKFLANHKTARNYPPLRIIAPPQPYDYGE